MKQSLLRLMLAANAFAPFRYANRRAALVLTYHRFGSSDLGTFTTARAFEEQLRYLADHYRLVPLSEIAERVARGGELPERAAAITVDDGYRDAYEIAFPLLRKYDAPASVFVVTDFLDRRMWVWTDKLRHLTTRTAAAELDARIGGTQITAALSDRASRLRAARRANEALKRLPDAAKDEEIARLAAALGVEIPAEPPAEFAPFTWAEAREMDAAGFSVESHTVTHPILTNAPDEQLRRELCDSRARLADELRRPASLFCYPNGDEDARVRREVARAGYRAAVTTRPGLNDARRSDPFALRRVHTEDDLAHFAQSTSGFESIKERLRGGGATNTAAAELG